MDGCLIVALGLKGRMGIAAWKRVARRGGDCFGATVDPRNPGRVYMCIAEDGSEPGLWRSDDAGETWVALEGMPFRNAQRVSFDPADASIIYNDRERG